ncbi:MAG: hypothetical protein M3539_07700, partial [Acidobacteriota bacterium]|nr:hypothetical protein [Acidobacteriota bacterium]
MTSNYRKLWTRRRSDFAAIAAIAAFFVLFFWPLLFGDNYFVTSDAFFYSYPLRTTAWNALHQRSLPLWTPLLLSGYPLISMGQIALGYPLTWGYAFMPGYKAEVIYVLAPFLLAPTFTYFYAREIGRSRLASLLAGLAFGYGGMMAGMLSNSGYTTNSVMWLPLILVGIERTRTYPFAHCVIWTTGAYTMSVLNGHGQTFMYVGLIALAYAVFVAFALMPSAERRRGLRELLTLQRLKPLAVTVTAILVAAGIAAPQILETLRATQFSIRRSLSYEVFVEGSFHLTAMLKSAVLPLHYDLEVTTYLSPLAICLAVFAVASVRHSARDPRVFFWAALALLAWLLMLGGNNPLYRLIYHVPLFNRFRVPARHSFEWTFAAGILAAYGWDAISDWINQRTSNTIGMARRWPRWLGLGALVLALLVGCFWWRAVYSSSEPMFYARTGYPAARYLLWKAGFLLTLFTGAWLSWHVVSHRWRTVLLTTAIVLACFPEPYMLISRWWFTAAKPESRFAVVSPSTRFLQQYPPDQNRVYSRVNLFVEENSLHPSVDPLNLTAIHGLQNVGGYEPLILERYS